MLFSHLVDIVRIGHRMHSMRQNQGEGENSEPDHDCRENQRLRHRIGEPPRDGSLSFGNDRSARARQPAPGEDQEVSTIAQESETDNQLRQAPPEHQIKAGSVQRAGGDGK